MIIENKMPVAVHFRYLKEDEMKNPLCCISKFCTLDIYIEDLRRGVINLIKSAYTNYENKTSRDIQNYMMSQRQIIKLMEVVHTLKYSGEDLKVSKDNPLYRNGSYWFGYHLDNRELISYPAIYFRQLTDNEVNNVTLFFEDLFSFMSLPSWHDTMDNLIFCACSGENYDDTYGDNGCPMIFIMEYLEKLVESIYLINYLRPYPF